MKIYLIEDDAALRSELARVLGFQGYTVEVCTQFSHAVEQALDFAPDVVIADLRLPETDGLDICRKLREKSDVPLLVLTSSDSEFDEVTALRLGADDYLTKPYSPAVLLAHVERLLQRAAGSQAPALEYAGAEVRYNGQVASRSRNELRILSALVQARGAIVSRQELMFELWQSDEFIDDNTLTVNVNRLRRALQRLGAPEDFLKTHRGQGYSL